MAIVSEPNPAPEGAAGYHGAVSAFKRRLIERSLLEARGNRTHAARALGLQRTYLLRLMRDLNVAAPPPPDRHRRAPDLSQDPAPPPPQP
jgi:DNA-binding NtrC family response regulator